MRGHEPARRFRPAPLRRLALAALLSLGNPGAAWASGPLALLDAVHLTLSSNPDIQLQEKQVEYSRGVLQQATGQFDPVLSLNAGHSVENSPLNRQTRDGYAGQGLFLDQVRNETTSYSLGVEKRLRNGMLLAPSMGVTNTTGTLGDAAGLPPQAQGRISFSLRVPLLKNGGLAAAAAEDAERLEWEAASQEMRFKVSQAILNTATAYWGFLAARENLEIAREAESGVRRMLEDTKKLVEADELPAADLYVLRANLQDKSAARIAAEKSLHDARQKLGAAMGLPQPRIALIEPLDGLPQPPMAFSALPEQSARLTVLAVARRADLAAARLRQDSARARLGAARDNLKPQLDVAINVGYAGLAESSGARAITGGLEQNRAGANAGASLIYQWPFDNNAARGLYRQQAAIHDQRTLRAASAEREIGIGVQSALSDLMHSAALFRESGETVELYRVAVENERTKHKLGTSTMIDVLSTHDRLLGARQNNVAYRLNTLSALARLNFETGALLAGETSGQQSVRLERLVSVPTPDQEREHHGRQ
jgi:outer membrane protein TolC